MTALLITALFALIPLGLYLLGRKSAPAPVVVMPIYRPTASEIHAARRAEQWAEHVAVCARNGYPIR